MKGLVVDFGGVLTTSVVDSFRAFCDECGISFDTLKAALRAEIEGADKLEREHPMYLLETGRIDGADFNQYLAGALSMGLPAPLAPDGLKDRLFASVRPEPSMVMAVARFRLAGVKTALLSNSWGGDGYPRETFGDMFDAVVISGEVGLRKPEPEIYLMTASLLDLDPAECVFVDDLRGNVEGAEAVGMTGLLHSDAEQTLKELERLFSISSDA